MKPPKKIYAKVDMQKGEEVLRMSTSPFLDGNIEYMLPPSPADKHYSPFISVNSMFPATDGSGKCRYALEVLRKGQDKIRIAYYSVAGFFYNRSYYSEYRLDDVYAWRYILDVHQLTVLHQQWPDHDSHVIIDTAYQSSAFVSNWPESKESWISNRFVEHAFRRQGIAQNLLDEAERQARYPIKIGVRKDAPGWLIEWYKKRGYEIVMKE